MPDTPEQKARVAIDAKLDASGWLVQDREDMDLTAGRGIAVREFPMKPGFGFADYLLYLDRKALGAIEAMADGILTGVEAQSAKYATGLPANFPAHQRPLPYLTDTDSLPAPPTSSPTRSQTSWKRRSICSAKSQRNSRNPSHKGINSAHYLETGEPEIKKKT
jgi:type I site-specific restriction endonuclease